MKGERKGAREGGRKLESEPPSVLPPDLSLALRAVPMVVIKESYTRTSPGWLAHRELLMEGWRENRGTDPFTRESRRKKSMGT